MIKIGVDLDNTIIDYKSAFIKINNQLKLNIPLGKINKDKIKKKIIRKFSIQYWTYIQEEIYGKMIHKIKPNCDLKNFILYFKNTKYNLTILSHKTKISTFSKKYFLRKEALKWIKKKIPYYNFEVRFFETIQEKINFINNKDFSYHIDDLDKIFDHKNFDNKCKRIYFNDRKKYDYNSTSWTKIKKFIINENY